MDAPLNMMVGITNPSNCRINPPSYDYVMTARTFGNAQASLALRSLILSLKCYHYRGWRSLYSPATSAMQGQSFCGLRS